MATETAEHRPACQNLHFYRQRERVTDEIISIHKENDRRVKVVLKTYSSVIQFTLWKACKKLLTLILDAFERGHLRMISDSAASFCRPEHLFTTFNLSTRNTFPHISDS